MSSAGTCAVAERDRRRDRADFAYAAVPRRGGDDRDERRRRRPVRAFRHADRRARRQDLGRSMDDWRFTFAEGDRASIAHPSRRSARRSLRDLDGARLHARRGSRTQAQSRAIAASSREGVSGGGLRRDSRGCARTGRPPARDRVDVYARVVERVARRVSGRTCAIGSISPGCTIGSFRSRSRCANEGDWGWRVGHRFPGRMERGGRDRAASIDASASRYVTRTIGAGYGAPERDRGRRVESPISDRSHRRRKSSSGSRRPCPGIGARARRRQSLVGSSTTRLWDRGRRAMMRGRQAASRPGPGVARPSSEAPAARRVRGGRACVRSSWGRSEALRARLPEIVTFGGHRVSDSSRAKVRPLAHAIGVSPPTRAARRPSRSTPRVKSSVPGMDIASTCESGKQPRRARSAAATERRASCWKSTR